MDEIELSIQRLVPGGSGLGFHKKQAVFVPLSAPGDRLRVQVIKKHRGHMEGRIAQVVQPGPGRCEPVCPYYGRCGGCQMQHLEEGAYRQAKQDMVADALRRIGRFQAAERLLAPLVITSVMLGYRRRVRFQLQRHQGMARLGFFETESHRLIDLQSCPVLHPKLDALMEPIRALLNELSAAWMPMAVEALCDEKEQRALTFMAKRMPPAGDEKKLRGFAEAQQLGHLAVAVGGKQRFALIEGPDLSYEVEGLRIAYRPGDFTQVHFEQNRKLVAEVLELAGSGPKATDMHSGIGNFTLPLTRRFKRVNGLEVAPSAVRRPQANARSNGVAQQTRFFRVDLEKEQSTSRHLRKKPGVVVLDPPRSGAVTVARLLARMQPHRVVYVSCDAATLARDAAHMAAAGYTLEQARIVDMFPHTSHVECVADPCGPNRARRRRVRPLLGVDESLIVIGAHQGVEACRVVGTDAEHPALSQGGVVDHLRGLSQGFVDGGYRAAYRGEQIGDRFDRLDAAEGGAGFDGIARLR